MRTGEREQFGRFGAVSQFSGVLCHNSSYNSNPRFTLLCLIKYFYISKADAPQNLNNKLIKNELVFNKDEHL